MIILFIFLIILIRPFIDCTNLLLSIYTLIIINYKTSIHY